MLPVAAGGLQAVVAAVYRYRWSLAPDHLQVTGTELTGMTVRGGHE